MKCNTIPVETAKEMHEAVMHHVNKKDIYIGTAAVSDYRPARKNETKLKKTIKAPL